MAIQFISTSVGRAKLNSSGTGNVMLATIGISSQYVAYNEQSVGLQNQIKTLPISGENVTDNIVHLSFVDDSNSQYSARAIGVYLSDGTLFAVASSPTPIFEKVAGTEQIFSFDWQLVDLSSASITFPGTQLSNPPASFAKRGVIEKADWNETLAGIDDDKAVVPKWLKAYIDKRVQDGIDAKSLGGQLPNFYTNIPARLGYMPLAPSAIQGMWTAFNDGPNSGLVADRLWDRGPNDFAHAEDFDFHAAPNGHYKSPQGIIMQWAIGSMDWSTDSSQFVPFEIQFPETCLFAICGTQIAQNNDSDLNYQIIGSPTSTGVNVRRQATKGDGNQSPSAPLIFAIGK